MIITDQELVGFFERPYINYSSEMEILKKFISRKKIKAKLKVFYQECMKVNTEQVPSKNTNYIYQYFTVIFIRYPDKVATRDELYSLFFTGFFVTEEIEELFSQYVLSEEEVTRFSYEPYFCSLLTSMKPNESDWDKTTLQLYKRIASLRVSIEGLRPLEIRNNDSTGAMPTVMTYEDGIRENMSTISLALEDYEFFEQRFGNYAIATVLASCRGDILHFLKGEDKGVKFELLRDTAKYLFQNRVIALIGFTSLGEYLMNSRVLSINTEEQRYLFAKISIREQVFAMKEVPTNSDLWLIVFAQKELEITELFLAAEEVGLLQGVMRGFAMYRYNLEKTSQLPFMVNPVEIILQNIENSLNYLPGKMKEAYANAEKLLREELGNFSPFAGLTFIKVF